MSSICICLVMRPLVGNSRTIKRSNEDIIRQTPVARNGAEKSPVQSYINPEMYVRVTIEATLECFGG